MADNKSNATDTQDKSDLGLDLDKFAMRTKDGSVDVQATHARFTHELHHFISSEKMDNEVIAAAVRQAFATHNVTTLPMGAVLQYTMELLNVAPPDYSMIRDRVQKYVRNNVNRFKVAKGKGGGVSWIPDQTAATPNASIPPSAQPSTPPSGTIRPRGVQAHQQ